MNLQELLGTEYPFIQGGMANIATGEFAAAVSNAGGLGLIGAGGMTTKELKENIDKCRQLTDKPFGVNLMMINPDVKEMAELLIQEDIKFITTGAGNPRKYISAWKEAGATVIPVIANSYMAENMEKLGADAVVAEGTEAGGHVGELSTMALLPQVVDSVDIPVIAAGGIASGRQLLAVHALGAVGAQLGTVLLASEECPIHDNYKQAVLDAKDKDTVVTGRISGIPVRILANDMSKEYVAKEKAGAGKMELEEYTLGALRRAVFDGDRERGSLMAGQVAGMINEIRPIRQIFEDLVSEYNDTLNALISK